LAAAQSHTTQNVPSAVVPDSEARTPSPIRAIPTTFPRHLFRVWAARVNLALNSWLLSLEFSRRTHDSLDPVPSQPRERNTNVTSSGVYRVDDMRKKLKSASNARCAPRKIPPALTDPPVPPLFRKSDWLACIV